MKCLACGGDECEECGFSGREPRVVVPNEIDHMENRDLNARTLLEKLPAGMMRAYEPGNA